MCKVRMMFGRQTGGGARGTGILPLPALPVLNPTLLTLLEPSHTYCPNACFSRTPPGSPSTQNVGPIALSCSAANPGSNPHSLVDGTEPGTSTPGQVQLPAQALVMVEAGARYPVLLAGGHFLLHQEGFCMFTPPAARRRGRTAAATSPSIAKKPCPGSPLPMKPLPGKG